MPTAPLEVAVYHDDVGAERPRNLPEQRAAVGVEVHEVTVTVVALDVVEHGGLDTVEGVTVLSLPFGLVRADMVAATPAGSLYRHVPEDDVRPSIEAPGRPAPVNRVRHGLERRTIALKGQVVPVEEEERASGGQRSRAIDAVARVPAEQQLPGRVEGPGFTQHGGSSPVVGPRR